MKLSKLLAAFMLIGAVALTACHIVPDEPDGPTRPGKDTTVIDPNQPGDNDTDWSDVSLPDGAINVAKAREIAAGLASGAATAETYYVYGIVKKFGSKHESGITDYGNATFYMVDNAADTDDFEAYQVYNLGGNKYTSLDQIAIGDRVIVYCHITNYNGTYETVGKGDGYVFWSSNPNAAGSAVNPPAGGATLVSITEAIAIANALEPKGKTTDNYRLENVIVDTIFTAASSVTQYGNINLRVKDATGATISCYYTNNIGNAKFTSASQMPKIGAIVSLEGPLKLYVNKDNTTSPEFENAWFTAISEVVGGEDVTPGDGGSTTSDTIHVAGVGASPEVINFEANPFGLSAETTYMGAAPVLVYGELTVLLDGSGNATSGMHVSTDRYKMYKGSSCTIKAPAGKNITSVTFSDAVSDGKYGAENITAAAGSYDTSAKTWTGSAASVTFSNTAQVRIKSITVTYE